MQTNDNVAPDFLLYQNYPNPFNPTTVLRFKLTAAAHVSLRIYDMLGREKALLVDEKLPAGLHKKLFDGSRLASGIYFARLKTASVNWTIKLVLCR